MLNKRNPKKKTNRNQNKKEKENKINNNKMNIFLN